MMQHDELFLFFARIGQHVLCSVYIYMCATGINICTYIMKVAYIRCWKSMHVSGYMYIK